MLSNQAQAFAGRDPRIPALVPQQRLDLQNQPASQGALRRKQSSVRCRAHKLNELFVQYLILSTIQSSGMQTLYVFCGALGRAKNGL